MTINGQTFSIVARNEIRKENEGILIDPIVPFKGEYYSSLFIAEYISADTTQTLKSLRINYLDTSGNCHIQAEGFFIYVSGQEVQQKQKTDQAKAFQESVIKLLFQLLSNPDNLQPPYRELAELANISVGSISNIMTGSKDEHFILRTKAKRVSKNKPNLLERWVIAHHDVLRPRLLKKWMRFSKKER